MSHPWRLFIPLAAFLAAIANPASGAERKEFFLKYRLSVNITEEFGGGQSVELVSKKDKSDPFGSFHSIPPPKDEPKYHGEPLYGAVKLGVKSDKMTVVLDNSTGGKLGYDTLYVDTKRDGRITRAEKLQGGIHGRTTSFGPIKLLVDSGGETCPQWFLFRLYENEYQGKISRHFVGVNAGSYQGAVIFGEHKRQLVIIDANGNGIYNDFMKGNRWECDRLLIEGGKDRKEEQGRQREETEPLGRFVLIDDKFWKLDVAADGSSVVVEPLEKPLGTIRSVHKDFNVLLAGEDGAIRIRSQDGTARLPHGSYSLAQCQFHLADTAGRRWDFTSYAADKTKPVNVAAGETISLPLGPPLVPKVLATLSGGDLSLNLELRGAGGEIYSNVSLGENKRPPVPKVRITDGAGLELAILDFHYG